MKVVQKNHKQSIWAICWLFPAILAICDAGSPTSARAEDLDDCALLFDSAIAQNSDINFLKICEFYGLRCQEIDLRTCALTDELLRDAIGQPLAGIGTNMQTLERTEPLLLDSLELTILKVAVESGAHLLISGLTTDGANDLRAVRHLTDGQVADSWPSFRNLNWNITDLQPEITREFSGQTIPYQGGESANSPIVSGSASVLINSLDRDNPAVEYSVFTALPLGLGMIFVDGANQRQSLAETQIRDLYYCYDFFYNIVPTMMFIRFAGGDECWHNDHNYANLTIDDPPLSNMQYGHLNFQDLLTEMQTHDFCTTIGMEPKDYQKSVDEVVNLFRNYPERYSIVQHGNNHDGFEFFAYDSAGSLAVCQERGWCEHRPRPLSEHEADIVEGVTRMAEFERLTGLPYGKAMIFPHGISPMPTLELLKEYNFLSTVNGLSIPIGAEGGANDVFNMRPTDLNYANFASCSRRHWVEDKLYLYDLFIDKPVLLYEHQGFFAQGPDAFNEAAAAINAVSGSAEWRGLGYILKHLYLQKSNDDGTISVLMYTNDLVLSNETTGPQFFDIQKKETLNVPLLTLTADGTPMTYSLTDSTLCFTLTIPPGCSKEIEILYGSGDRDFAISDEDLYFDPQVSDTIAVTVHNYGSDGGPVPVQFFDSHPDSGGTALDLATIERIGPDSSKVIKRALSEMISGIHRLYVILDPYDVISETDEENNVASATVSVPDELVLDDFEYEDSPLNHGWVVDEGSGALTVVFDSTLNSRVMEVVTEEGTGFRISHTAFDSPKHLFSLKMRAAEFFILYVRVQTTIGEYYLQYTPDTGVDTVSGSYVCFHLGPEYQDSHWHTLQRDLAADVSFQLDAVLSWVKFFVLRGSYRLDDVVLSQPSTAVVQGPDGEGLTPGVFALLANYPNPFNSGTTLTYHLSAERNVKLNIYNVLGQRVVTLADGKQPAGMHKLIWNGRDGDGLPVTSGVYFCALQVEDTRKIIKMVLLR